MPSFLPKQNSYTIETLYEIIEPTQYEIVNTIWQGGSPGYPQSVWQGRVWLIFNVNNCAYLAFGETFSFCIMYRWFCGEWMWLPLFSTQVVPSKMKLDDLIRTSLMVMAVARAGEQQSVIRWVGIVQLQGVCKIQKYHRRWR